MYNGHTHCSQLSFVLFHTHRAVHLQLGASPTQAPWCALAGAQRPRGAGRAVPLLAGVMQGCPGGGNPHARVHLAGGQLSTLRQACLPHPPKHDRLP